MKRFTRILAVVIVLVMTFSALSVFADATELKTGIGVVMTGQLRLRAKPNTDSEILGTAHMGDSVVIIREVGDWYLVNFNLKIGYMYKDYITFKARENVKIGYASFDSVANVRKGPGTENSVVAQAPKGETCFIIGFNNGWYKVSFNGKLGYVRSDLLTLLEIPYENYGSPGNTYHESPKAATSSAPVSTVTNSDLGQQIADFAMKYLGYRYVYGGASPSTGFDCSGLTSYVAKQFGFSIGRTAAQQLNAGTYVSRENLRPGDIVLFERTYSSSEAATHAGIYLGNGKFIHAANSSSGVVITELSSEYYSSRFVCGRRLG